MKKIKKRKLSIQVNSIQHETFLRKLIRIPLEPLVKMILENGGPEDRDILEALSDAADSEITHCEHLSNGEYEAVIIKTADGRITTAYKLCASQKPYHCYSMNDTRMSRSIICIGLGYHALPNDETAVPADFLLWPFPDNVEKLANGEEGLPNISIASQLEAGLNSKSAVLSKKKPRFFSWAEDGKMKPSDPKPPATSPEIVDFP